jgi:hypothetical protein
MPVLIITPIEQGSVRVSGCAPRKPFIVDFDPSKESQEDVERRHGVTFSEYHQDRLHAERALNMLTPDWS